MFFYTQNDSVDWFFAQKKFLWNLADWKSFFVIFVYPLIPIFVPSFRIFWFSPVFPIFTFLRNIQINSRCIFLNFFKKFCRKNVFRFYIFHFWHAVQRFFRLKRIRLKSSKSSWNSNYAFTAGVIQALMCLMFSKKLLANCFVELNMQLFQFETLFSFKFDNEIIIDFL